MAQLARESYDAKAPMVTIAASVVYWMHEKPQKGSICNGFGLFENDLYELLSCDPTKLARIGPLLTAGGLADHITGKYEYALSNLHPAG